MDRTANIFSFKLSSGIYLEYGYIRNSEAPGHRKNFMTDGTQHSSMGERKEWQYVCAIAPGPVRRKNFGQILLNHKSKILRARHCLVLGDAETNETHQEVQNKDHLKEIF